MELEAEMELECDDEDLGERARELFGRAINAALWSPTCSEMKTG